jgi:hypothetical protein
VNQLLSNPHDKDLTPSTVPLTLQRAGLVIFVVGMVVSGVFSITEHWRRATFSLGATLVWLSVLRLTCDSQVLGVLAVRSRKFDAVFTALGGAAMLFLSASVDALGS